MNRGFSAKYWGRPALLAFGAGVLVGVVFGSRPETVESAPKTAPLHESTRTMGTVNNGGTASVMPSPEPGSQSAPHAADYLARLQALSDVNEDLERKISVGMLIGEDLNETFVRVFGLSPAEAQQLREAVTATHRKLKELEARVATIARSGKGEFIVTIPEAPVEGGIIYDDLMQEIRDTLGPRRLNYAERLSSLSFEPMFERFGLRHAEIHLRPMRDEQGQPTQRWWTSSDESNGTMTRTIFMDPSLLKNRFPLIHQKMLDGGFLAPEP